MVRTIDLVRIKTTLGERTYPLDTRVYSNISGKNMYLRKYAGDVREGEALIWHNESIDTTLEEIEPYLSKSPRYQRAESWTYLTNSSGQKIPRFRAELIRAIAANGIIGTEDLERKIMREEGDFTAQEYSLMQDYIFEKVKQVAERDNTPQREKSTISAWLHGTINAPLTPDLIYALAVGTESKTFTDWWETAGQRDGYWLSYTLYNTIRRGIMSYLARSRNEMKKAVARSSGYKGEEHSSIMPEAQIILSQFMEEINAEFSLARVSEVEIVAVDIREWRSRKDKYGEKLAKGLYTGEAPEDAVLINLEEMRQGEKDASIAALAVLSLEDHLSYSHLFFEVLNGTIKNLGFNSTAFTPVQFSVEQKQFTASIAETLADRILSTEFDAELGLEAHATYRVCEAYGKLSNALPKVYIDWKKNLSIVHSPSIFYSREERRQSEIDHRKRSTKILGRYGWNGDISIFLLPGLMRYHDFFFWRRLPKKPGVFVRENPEEWEKMTRDYSEYIAMMDDPEFVRSEKGLRAIYNEIKGTVLTRGRVYEIFEKYHMPWLGQVIPESNFAFEPQTMPAKKTAQVAERSDAEPISGEKTGLLKRLWLKLTAG